MSDQHSGIARFGDELFRKFADGSSLSASFTRRSLSSIHGSSAILPVEWSNFAAHTYFNSAELKTTAALKKVIDGYPVGLSGASITALSSGDVISYENFILQLNGFEKYVLNYLGGVTGNSYLNPSPTLTAIGTSIGGVSVPMIALGRNAKNGLTGDFATLSASLLSLAQTFDAGLNTLQLISGTAADFDIIYFDDGSYYSNRILPDQRIEYVNRQSNMVDWIPEAMKTADSENNLIRFMGTVGSIYDDIKLYIDQFANVNHISYDDWDRYPDGRIPVLIAKHFGFELIDTLLRQDLSSYLRRDTNKVPLYEISYKIWNRILNNLIYLYKKKGTLEAVRALIRIYGIPDNYLSIDDFNFHPESTEVRKIDYKNVRVLSFYGGDRVNFNGFSLGTGDLTLEARVTASSITSAGCVVSYGDGTDNIQIEVNSLSAILRADNTGGAVKVFTSGSSTALLGSAVSTKWVNLFAIRRSSIGEIWASWIDDSSGSAIYSAVSAARPWATLQAPATLGFFIGAATTGEVGSAAVVSGWVGDIHEVKAFKFALSEADIREHTQNFESVSWMNSGGSFDGVVGQWKLKENTVLSGANWVVNSWTLSSSLTGYGQGSITSSNHYKMIESMAKETQYTTIGEFADDNINIYIEDGTEITSPYKKSNILNIGFRPVARVNDDILNVYGDLNVTNLIGDPINFLSTVSGSAYGYPVESVCAQAVFKRWAQAYPGAKIDFNAYIDVLENLAPLIEGIMHDINQLIPARTVMTNKGVIIENHLLESNRVHTNPPGVFPETVNEDVISPEQNFSNSDLLVAGQGEKEREEWEGNPVSTRDYDSLSEEQLQSLQNNYTVAAYRIVGNSTIYPFEQKVSDPTNTSLQLQANRVFLCTDSTKTDWTTSVSGVIKLIRRDMNNTTGAGKVITSQENCIRIVIPCSTSADLNGTVTAQEHWVDVFAKGSILDPSLQTFDFTIPTKSGLEFVLTPRTKFLDRKIGFLTFQLTNLLSGTVGTYTIFVSTDEADVGGVIELPAEVKI